MPAQHKILVLDDETGFLQMCQELLSALPMHPEVHTVTSGADALARLDTEPFSLLLTDLRMPGMDGFQVLSIVRRKHPNLRTIVMTAAVDEQYRTRAYSLGIDLYLEKPRTSPETKLFIECIESLLSREEHGGFRGVQSKSLMDIIQMECVSMSSTVLKIRNGPVEGRIWIQTGDVVDAETGSLAAEEAFKAILAWKSGSFETLPPDPTRERRIFANYQGILLDSAQTADEVRSGEIPVERIAEGTAPASPLAMLAKFKGVEFVVVLQPAAAKPLDHWSCANPDQVADWTRKTLQSFRALGEKLNLGGLDTIVGIGTQRNLGVAPQGERTLCAGFSRTLPADEARKTLKQMLAQWAS
ncbi:MAG: response regulator [Verrucomicrobia bacterium]|nr:response regulator [Verrucomicrobiota bacterium]